MTKTTNKISKAEAEIALAARGLGTHAAALAASVAIDVKKWGEGEREASLMLHGCKSYGLLINRIAVHDPNNLDEELMGLAAAVMTAADRSALREGG